MLRNAKEQLNDNNPPPKKNVYLSDIYLIRNDGGKNQAKLNKIKQEPTLFQAPESHFHYLCSQAFEQCSFNNKKWTNCKQCQKGNKTIFFKCRPS